MSSPKFIPNGRFRRAQVPANILNPPGTGQKIPISKDFRKNLENDLYSQPSVNPNVTDIRIAWLRQQGWVQ